VRLADIHGSKSVGLRHGCCDILFPIHTFSFSSENENISYLAKPNISYAKRISHFRRSENISHSAKPNIYASPYGRGVGARMCRRRRGHISAVLCGCGYTSSVAFATASPQGEALVYGAASRESSSSMENDNVDWK